VAGFVWGLIFIAVGVLAFVYRRRFAGTPSPTNKKRSPWRGRIVVAVAVGVALIGVLIVIGRSVVVVPARNVAVVNTFGRAEGALDNGWHWIKPWSSIEIIDATVQNINLDQDNKNCATVRLANQTTACVDLTLQWNIDQHANANELWQRYRGSNDDVVGNVGRNVVERELRRALNVVFEKYNPLSVLSGDGTPSISTADLASQAVTIMRSSVDKGIVIDTLLISVVHYDDVTQQKLNGYAQALADTQIAAQQKKTAEQQKQANDLLAAASSNDAGVKYQNCLNLIKDLAAKGQLQNLPATFTCGDGAQTPVIVGQK
jgi:regulator of protease activity HflC (stomatin/prohibitin superfamily)